MTAGSADRPLPLFVEDAPLMLVDGKGAAALSGRTIPVENPATGRVFTAVPDGEAADVDLAVHAARRSFEAGVWRKMSAVQRERILWRLTDLLEANLDELVELEIIDNGMPISLIRRAVERAIDGFRYYAGGRLQ